MSYFDRSSYEQNLYIQVLNYIMKTLFTFIILLFSTSAISQTTLSLQYWEDAVVSDGEFSRAFYVFSSIDDDQYQFYCEKSELIEEMKSSEPGTWFDVTFNEEEFITALSIRDGAPEGDRYKIVQSFTSASEKDISCVDVLSIAYTQYFIMAGGMVKLIITGTKGATDFGAYNSIYLVYENGSEMPYRYSTYFIGNFGGEMISQQISDDKLQFDLELFEHKDKKFCEYCLMRVIIDLAFIEDDLTRLDQGDDYYDGHFHSIIGIEVKEKIEE